MNILKQGTIQDCEEAVENTLSTLQKMDSTEIKSLPGLEILVPAGFRPVVELRGEDGRKKRRTASADNWSPSKGEIRIYFEAAEAEPAPTAAPSYLKPRSLTRVPLAETELTPTAVATPSVAPRLDQILAELLDALREAENSPSRTFVALKWFRDEYLPSTRLSWAQSEEQRRAVLSDAIKDGWILTSKVQNPKAPMYPTTTIRSNRQKQGGVSGPPVSRFRPVPVSGEPLSSTILRDRGPR